VGLASADARQIGATALLMIAAQVYTSGSVESWTVSGSFGQRRFVAITPLLVLGLAALLSHAQAGWPRRALAAGVVLCVWWNLGLMAQFGLNRMDRTRLTLGANARATFLDCGEHQRSRGYLTIARRYQKHPSRHNRMNHEGREGMKLLWKNHKSPACFILHG
jgi:hypothetical protein